MICTCSKENIHDSNVKLTIAGTDMCIYKHAHVHVCRLDVVSQALAAVVVVFERKSGIRSSGTLIVFWMAMLAYSTMKLRTLILLSKDAVRKEGGRELFLLKVYLIFACFH